MHKYIVTFVENEYKNRVDYRIHVEAKSPGHAETLAIRFLVANASLPNHYTDFEKRGYLIKHYDREVERLDL